MLLLVVLALLTIIAFGDALTIHWLFMVALVMALLWAITVFLGGIGRRRRGAWW